MEQSTYAVESRVEATHWWFTERRRLFGRVLQRLALPSNVRILDIGTSTGTNLRLLRDLGFSNFEGVDMSPESVRWCSSKGLGQVTLGDVCKLPFADETFELVLATDIIEHVDDDFAALREIRRVLKPDGVVLLTVPTFMSLWGLQDDVSHHKRRYRLPQLLKLARRTGLEDIRSFYFNYLLFLPIWSARQIIRLLDLKLKSENEINASWLNGILKLIFRLDVTTAPSVKPPFGVSCMVVAKKANGVSQDLVHD